MRLFQRRTVTCDAVGHGNEGGTPTDVGVMGTWYSQRLQVHPLMGTHLSQSVSCTEHSWGSARTAAQRQCQPAPTFSALFPISSAFLLLP